MKEGKRQLPYGSFPVVNTKGERVESVDVEKILETKVIQQTTSATYYLHKVRLKDGREIVIKDVEIEGLG